MEMQSSRYTLACDRFGNYLLTRLSDNASAYFQGDDAWEWDKTVAALCRVKQSRRTEIFDSLASEYDCVLEVE